MGRWWGSAVVSARLKMKWPTVVSAGRDHHQAFWPKIWPTPPGGGSAGRSAGQTTAWWFGRPTQPAEPPDSRKSGRHHRLIPIRFALCMHRLVCGPPNLPLLRLASLDAGDTPAPPLSNKTLAVATDRLLCAPPCVCTTLNMHRLVCGPPNLPLLRLASLDAGDTPAPLLNNKTPVVATDLLLCAPPCACTRLNVHRLVCGLPNLPLLRLASLNAGDTRAPPLNNKTPTVATDRLLYAPPCVCTALCVHRPVYAPPRVWTAEPCLASPPPLVVLAGRHHRRAEPPEPNQPSQTNAEGTTGSFRPTTALPPGHYGHPQSPPARHVMIPEDT